MRKFLLFVALLGALSLLMVACGGGEDDAAEPASSGDAAARGEALYKKTAIGAASAPGCVTCHSLDEGVTLAEVSRRLLAQGASQVLSAVFADKDIAREKPIHADFVGVQLPNRYVFGYGMDVKGAWRNLPAVYAVKNA